MLVEFRVSNYRSFREPQVLSMVAAKDSSLKESNCIRTDIDAIPQLLRSIALYGPNAGGKSNLIAALAFMRSMVETSAVGVREGQALNVVPFRLDPETIEQPTEFEVTFINDKIRYQYGFALTSKRVVKEWLLASAGRKSQRWFEREFDNKTNQDNWYFGSYLLGGHQRQLWKESTRANALFLSTAVNLNSEQLRPIFNWFVNKLMVLNGNTPFLSIAHTVECLNDELKKPLIIRALQAADLGITDVQVEMRKVKVKQFGLRSDSESLVSEVKETEMPVIIVLHRGKNGKTIGFDLSVESQGTQRLFAYVGPLTDILQQGRILIVDELDSSLHPKMVQFIISLIHNLKLNRNNAQLIFSTHDTSLLDPALFRRDQIWFVEKDQDQASGLYPLTDFKPRKDEALERGYLMGRYGALPFFGELKF